MNKILIAFFVFLLTLNAHADANFKIETICDDGYAYKIFHASETNVVQVIGENGTPVLCGERKEKALAYWNERNRIYLDAINRMNEIRHDIIMGWED